MPLSITAPRRHDYGPLLHKLKRRLEGWKARFLSRAGKLLLVKTVLSAIPIYYMSCFALPKWHIARIDAIRRQFLWTRPQTPKSIHLLNWQTVCLPIKNGGLGVVNLQLLNTALLLRWRWRLHTSNHKLWSTYASLIYSRSHTNDRPLILSSHGSFFWTSITKIKPIFHSAVTFQIFSSTRTSFWYDAWAGQPLATHQLQQITHKAISVFHAKSKFHQLIPAPFTLAQNEAFQRINSLTTTIAPDQVVWRLSRSEEFSIKSMYKLLSQGGKISSTFCTIWKAKVTPSMSLFFFFLLQNRLLTHNVMTKRHLTYTPGCVMCTLCPSETSMHLFFTCPFATAIWQALASSLGYNLVHLKDSPLATYLASAPPSIDRRRLWQNAFITTTYHLWIERNIRTFRNTATAHHILTTKILHEAALCFKHC